MVELTTQYQTSTHPNPLSESEQVQACCAIAREKFEIGDYEAGVAALKPWWELGRWPKQVGLSQQAAGELLLTAGMLSGWIASTKQNHLGQKPA